MEHKTNNKIENKKTGCSMLYAPRSMSRGFTLVETLVSLLIFSSSVVALISVTSKGLSDVVQVKNKLSATYLAEEGIEFIRNIRDANISSSGPLGWNQFIAEVSPLCLPPDGCNFKFAISPVSDFEIFQCVSGVNDPCKLGTVESSGLYIPGYGSGFATFPSPYYRRITIEPGNGEEVKVVSEVTWSQGLAFGSVKLEEYLYNW